MLDANHGPQATLSDWRLMKPKPPVNETSGKQKTRNESSRNPNKPASTRRCGNSMLQQGIVTGRSGWCSMRLLLKGVGCEPPW